MKIQYDAEVDALYIEFHPLATGTAENRPLSYGVQRLCRWSIDTVNGLQKLTGNPGRQRGIR